MPITSVDKRERKIPTPHISSLQPADNESSMGACTFGHDQKVLQAECSFSSLSRRFEEIFHLPNDTLPPLRNRKNRFCSTLANGVKWGVRKANKLGSARFSGFERKENVLELLSYSPRKMARELQDISPVLFFRHRNVWPPAVYATQSENKVHCRRSSAMIQFEVAITLPCYKYHSATASNLDLDYLPQVLNTSPNPTQGGQAKFSSPNPLDGTMLVSQPSRYTAPHCSCSWFPAHYMTKTLACYSALVELCRMCAISVTFVKVLIRSATSGHSQTTLDQSSKRSLQNCIVMVPGANDMEIGGSYDEVISYPHPFPCSGQSRASSLAGLHAGSSKGVQS
ncbi:hypothetical protein BD779DRAFT_1473863 [Infundibulicybe gibba]|nr:hypothetical protein BD779DRAFT_1473863 [Infundibulicybe gibba]